MGYDFESDKAFNVENQVAMDLEIEKTCYSGGEFVNGTITLRPKEGLKNPILSNPQAILNLTEYFFYSYVEDEFNPATKRKEFVTKDAEENNTLLTVPLNFNNFYNANIMNTLKIPFQIQIPINIYPTCIFGSTAYVKHYLSIDFPSIMAKKTLVIVIKNNSYFSKYNGLLQQPSVCYKEVKKHKLLVSKGSFKATLKLPINSFSYDEMIPFDVDIDCTKLSMDIKGIKVTINRNQKRNFKRNHNEARSENKSEIASKTIKIDSKKNKQIHIQDTIKLNSDSNPKQIYNLLDTDKRKYSEKYKGIYLSPSCYGGLLSCEYYIKMVVQMDTMWSTDVDFRLPIDLYEPFMLPNYPPNNQYPPQQPYPNQQQYPPQQIPPRQYPPQQIPPQQYPPQQIPPQQYPPQQSPQQQYPSQQPYPNQQQYPPQQSQQQPYPPQQPYPQQPYPPQQSPQQQYPTQQPYPNQQQYPPQQPYPNQQQYPPQQSPQQQYPPQQPYPNQQQYPPQQSPPQQYPSQQPYPNEKPAGTENYPSFDSPLGKNDSENAAPPTLNQILSNNK